MGILIGFVTGMPAEARLLRGQMVGIGTASAMLLVRQGAKTLVSFGVAGGLAPALRPGALVVSDAAWAERLGAVHGRVVGVDAPVCSLTEKRRLAESGMAVDMESHVVEQVARESGVAFVAIRAVLDPAERAVPPSALALWRGKWRAPLRDWPALARLAVDYAQAMAALRAVAPSL